VDQDPDLLEEVIGGARCARTSGYDGLNVLTRHLMDLAMAHVVVDDEPLDDAAVLSLGLRGEPEEVRAGEVVAGELIEGPLPARSGLRHASRRLGGWRLRPRPLFRVYRLK
jgi:hypothetical protein